MGSLVIIILYSYKCLIFTFKLCREERPPSLLSGLRANLCFFDRLQSQTTVRSTQHLFAPKPNPQRSCFVFHGWIFKSRQKVECPAAPEKHGSLHRAFSVSYFSLCAKKKEICAFVIYWSCFKALCIFDFLLIFYCILKRMSFAVFSNFTAAFIMYKTYKLFYMHVTADLCDLFFLYLWCEFIIKINVITTAISQISSADTLTGNYLFV